MHRDGVRPGVARGRSWFLAVMLACAAQCVGAQPLIPGYPDAVDAYDPREVRLLPRYCTFTQSFRDKVPGGQDAAEINRWYAYMGDVFHALHHYCWGMMKTNRALFLAPNRQVREYYLQSSIQEFDYVINHATDEFVLMPEILNKRAENLVRLNRGPEALLNLEKAIQLKPDYWPPYATAGDFFKDQGNLTKAREWLEKGLQQAPDARALQRRLSELSKRTPRDNAGEKK